MESHDNIRVSRGPVWAVNIIWDRGSVQVRWSSEAGVWLNSPSPPPQANILINGSARHRQFPHTLHNVILTSFRTDGVVVLVGCTSSLSQRVIQEVRGLRVLIRSPSNKSRNRKVCVCVLCGKWIEGRESLSIDIPHCHWRSLGYSLLVGRGRRGC